VVGISVPDARVVEIVRSLGVRQAQAVSLLTTAPGLAHVSSSHLTMLAQLLEELADVGEFGSVSRMLRLCPAVADREFRFLRACIHVVRANITAERGERLLAMTDPQVADLIIGHIQASGPPQCVFRQLRALMRAGVLAKPNPPRREDW